MKIKFLMVLSTIFLISACVTAPQFTAPVSAVKMKALADGEILGFVNLLPDKLHYVPRDKGFLDRREYPYADAKVSIDKESFEAWKDVTQSYIQAKVVDHTGLIKEHASSFGGSPTFADIASVVRSRSEQTRFLVVFSPLAPVTIGIPVTGGGYISTSANSPGSICLDSVPFHGPLVICGIQVKCYDLETGKRLYSYGFGSYEKTPGLPIYGEFGDYSTEQMGEIIAAVRSGLEKASVGPAKKLASM